MNTNEQNNDLKKNIQILPDENYSEWKLQMIICLKQRRLYQYCIAQCIQGDGVIQTPTVDAKIIDTNVGACGLITNFLDSREISALVTSEETTQNSYLLWKTVNKRFASSTFNSKARLWSQFQKLTYDNSLKDFIANTRKCLSDIASVGIAVEEERIAFFIINKLPEEFHCLIEKVTLNAETQGNTDAILNVLHEATLKEDALPTDTSRALVHQKLFIIVATGNIIHLLPHMDQKNSGNYIPS
ncbi:hypothetical protein O181_025723 [Austropuccinia psidii MF-1]|uniref:DUF4219 domain-containing protein n=1 Tax=Austropuccinia psidii MF-1 TaxID=1389203 RepID=A0A9Q3GZD8_9BASI|nr:hypothetical protein [Austropuccinia psidii MF-1]